MEKVAPHALRRDHPRKSFTTSGLLPQLGDFRDGSNIND